MRGKNRFQPEALCDLPVSRRRAVAGPCACRQPRTWDCETSDSSQNEGDSWFAPSLGLRYSEDTSNPARRPSAGAMPGRCGFCLRGETHRPTCFSPQRAPRTQRGLSMSSFPRSAWERKPGRSASRPNHSRDAERREVRSHAERGDENNSVFSVLSVASSSGTMPHLPDVRGGPTHVYYHRSRV